MKLVAVAILCMFGLTGCSEVKPAPRADAIPSGDPKEDRDGEFRGFIYKKATMVGARDTFRWAQTALSGYRNAGENDFPSAIKSLPAAKCKFAAPADADLVRHVHIGAATQRAPVFAYSNEDIASQAKYFIGRYIKADGKYRVKVRKGINGGSAMRVANVIVTETDAPVYLVLSGQFKTLWNIQKAPGATISAITVVGDDTQGVANAPEGTLITAVTGKWMEKCKVEPARMPRDDWRYVKNVGGMKSQHEALREDVKLANAYQSWLRRSFKLRSTPGSIGAYGISNVLVGPPPGTLAERVPYKPIKDAVVMLTRNDHVFAANQEVYGQRFSKLVMTAAKRAAGGDLTMLLN